MTTKLMVSVVTHCYPHTGVTLSSREAAAVIWYSVMPKAADSTRAVMRNREASSSGNLESLFSAYPHYPLQKTHETPCTRAECNDCKSAAGEGCPISQQTGSGDWNFLCIPALFSSFYGIKFSLFFILFLFCPHLHVFVICVLKCNL